MEQGNISSFGCEVLHKSLFPIHSSSSEKAHTTHVDANAKIIVQCKTIGKSEVMDSRMKRLIVKKEVVDDAPMLVDQGKMR